MEDNRGAGRGLAANFALIADMDLPVEANRAKRIKRAAKP
jgi:hypothetical protein